tara:strand:- start:1708 stop:2415 length:708 start_codon:yes stop_codon:yes gene_type:complete
MNIELYFGSVKDEIEKKNHSLMNITNNSENDFLSLCEAKLDKSDIPVIIEALNFSRKIKSIEKNHQSSPAYFIHAVRVATHIAGTMKFPDLDSIKTGLIHNVYEIAGMEREQIISNGFSEFTAKSIELTTIDREQQFDDKYLTKYYQNMVEFDERLVLIRCLDKLDNLLGLEVIADGDLRDNWLRSLEKFIVPLSFSIDKNLGCFIEDTLRYAKSTGCNEELRIELEKNLKNLTH